MSDTRARTGGEDGIALITALLAVVILSGLAVVFVATAMFESQSSGLSRNSESAIHVAEAAVDDLIPDLSMAGAIDTFVTCAPRPSCLDDPSEAHMYDLADDATAEEQRAWALGIAGSVEDSDLVRLADGEGYAIRPVNQTTQDPMHVIYAVGWVPSRASAPRPKVLKIEFDSLRYVLDAGLLVGGSLDFGGDACVLGSHGGVHANDDVKVVGGGNTTGGDCGTGQGWKIEQDFSTSGDIDGVNCDSPPASIQGECYEGVPPQPIPEIRARQVYAMHEQAAAPWYDLCPDGKMRAHAGSGEPCSSTTILWNGSGSSFRGWRFHNNEWQTHAGGEGGAHPGVYYVYERNAQVQHTSGTGEKPVTVVVEAKAGDGGAASGHIRVSAEPRMSSALSHLTLVADRDIQVRGNAHVRGLVAAREQIELSGEPTVIGAVVAQDALNTPNSRIDCGSEVTCPSSVSGRVTIEYDDTFDPPLGGLIRITNWHEL